MRSLEWKVFVRSWDRAGRETVTHPTWDTFKHAADQYIQPEIDRLVDTGEVTRTQFDADRGWGRVDFKDGTFVSWLAEGTRV